MPDKSKNPLNFWQELKRRKVIRVIIGYAASAFIILEAVDIIFPRMGLPDWTVTLVIFLLIIGFIFAIIFSWIFDFTPEGLKKTESAKVAKEKTQPEFSKRRLKISNGVIAVLVVVVGILLYPKIFKRDKLKDTRNDDERSVVIAVLPFSNTKPDPETDYLGFAIADQIIGNLVYLKSITVRSSSSIRKYEKQVIDPVIVGDDLKVDYVLIGYYLKEANIVRLNVELVETNKNEMIWRCDQIQVDYQNAFQLQDIVAQKVVEGMNLQFSQKERNRMRKDNSDNPLAYEYYLRSISYPLTNEGDRLAIEMLNKSIELDSTFAPAYDQLGFRIHTLAQYGLLNPEEYKRGEDALLKALSLNEELLSALGHLVLYFTETARIEEAVELTKKMFEINPNNAYAHFALGYIYRFAGMNNQAIKEMERAIAIDPNNQRFRSICTTYMYAREYEKAFEVLKDYEPSPWINEHAGFIFFRQGKQEQAVKYFDQAIAIEPDGLPALLSSAVKAYIENNIEVGIFISGRFEQYNLADAEAWYYNACNYGLLGDRDGCIRCLKRAVDGGFFNYPFMLNDIFLDSMRDDPEFQIILEQAKGKHFAFKKRFF